MSRTVLAFVSGVVLVAAPTTRAEDAEDKAEKSIKESGGQVLRDMKKPGKPVVHVVLGGGQATEATMKQVAVFKHLEKLFVADGKVTDAAVKELFPLKNLRDLYVGGDTLTDDGVKEI